MLNNGITSFVSKLACAMFTEGSCRRLVVSGEPREAPYHSSDRTPVFPLTHRQWDMKCLLNQTMNIKLSPKQNVLLSLLKFTLRLATYRHNRSQTPSFLPKKGRFNERLNMKLSPHKLVYRLNIKCTLRSNDICMIMLTHTERAQRISVFLADGLNILL